MFLSINNSLSMQSCKVLTFNTAYLFVNNQNSVRICCGIFIEKSVLMLFGLCCSTQFMFHVHTIALRKQAVCIELFEFFLSFYYIPTIIEEILCKRVVFGIFDTFALTFASPAKMAIESIVKPDYFQANFN